MSVGRIKLDDGSQELYADPDIGSETVDRSHAFPEQARSLSAALDRWRSALRPLPGAGGAREPLTSREIERLRATGYMD